MGFTWDLETGSYRVKRDGEGNYADQDLNFGGRMRFPLIYGSGGILEREGQGAPREEVDQFHGEAARMD